MAHTFCNRAMYYCARQYTSLHPTYVASEVRSLARPGCGVGVGGSTPGGRGEAQNEVQRMLRWTTRQRESSNGVLPVAGELLAVAKGNPLMFSMPLSLLLQ